MQIIHFQTLYCEKKHIIINREMIQHLYYNYFISFGLMYVVEMLIIIMLII